MTGGGGGGMLEPVSAVTDVEEGTGPSTRPTGLPLVGESGWRHRRVREATFPRTAWGHRGYEEGPVDAYVAHLAGEVAAAEDLASDLRAEIDRLHRYIRRQWAVAGETDPPAALVHADELAERKAAEARRRVVRTEHAAQRRLAAAAAEAERRLTAADRTAADRLARAEHLAAQRLAGADAIAEQLLAEARRRGSWDPSAPLPAPPRTPAEPAKVVSIT